MQAAAQEAPKKTYQELYIDACQKAGELQYRVFMHKLELKKLNKHIKKLNLDAHREIQKQQAVAQAMAKKQEAKLHAVESSEVPSDVIDAQFGTHEHEFKEDEPKDII